MSTESPNNIHQPEENISAQNPELSLKTKLAITFAGSVAVLASYYQYLVLKQQTLQYIAESVRDQIMK